MVGRGLGWLQRRLGLLGQGVLLLALVVGGAVLAGYGRGPAAGPARGTYEAAAAALQAGTPGSGPEVVAPSAILLDVASGQILFEKNGHERRAPASVTKLMTLDLVAEALEEGRVHMTDKVPTSSYAESFGGTQLFLEVGEEMALEDLLYGLAVFSGNDAAIALAEHVAGDVGRFVEMMNERSRQLGMKDTHWANPHGLPGYENHYTSAHDLGLLSRHLVTRHPSLLKYTSTWEHWIRKGQKNEVWLTNHNRGLHEYPGMDGLKTGWTNAAGYCLSATAQRDGRRLIAVVMGATTSKERNQDIYRLLDYGYAAFETVTVARKGTAVGKVAVYEGAERQVDVVPGEDVAITLPRGQKAKLTHDMQMAAGVIAPVAAGQTLGEIRVRQGSQEVRRVPLVAAGAVAKAGILQLMGRYWGGIWRPASF